MSRKPALPEAVEAGVIELAAYLNSWYTSLEVNVAELVRQEHKAEKTSAQDFMNEPDINISTRGSILKKSEVASKESEKKVRRIRWHTSTYINQGRKHTQPVFVDGQCGNPCPLRAAQQIGSLRIKLA